MYIYIYRGIYLYQYQIVISMIRNQNLYLDCHHPSNSPGAASIPRRHDTTIPSDVTLLYNCTHICI